MTHFHPLIPHSHSHFPFFILYLFGGSINMSSVCFCDQEDQRMLAVVLRDPGLLSTVHQMVKSTRSGER